MVGCCHVGDSSDVTLAFEDAQFIPPFSWKETNDTYYIYRRDDTDDIDDKDNTDDTDNRNDSDDTDDTVGTEYAGISWNLLKQAEIGLNRPD